MLGEVVAGTLACISAVVMELSAAGVIDHKHVARRLKERAAEKDPALSTDMLTRLSKMLENPAPIIAGTTPGTPRQLVCRKPEPETAKICCAPTEEELDMADQIDSAEMDALSQSMGEAAAQTIACLSTLVLELSAAGRIDDTRFAQRIEDSVVALRRRNPNAGLAMPAKMLQILGEKVVKRAPVVSPRP